MPRPSGVQILRFFAWLWVLVGQSISTPAGDKRRRVGHVGAAAPHIVQPTGADARCWVFTHMPKSGGSTVKSILYGWRGMQYTFLYNSVAWKLGERYAETFALDSSNWRLAVGGYSEVLRRHGGEGCKWFTVFRHPVARLLSAFYYCHKKPQDQVCASSVIFAQNVDLVTFARLWGNFGLRQFALGNLDIDEVLRVSASTSSRSREWPAWYIVKQYWTGVATRDDGDGDALFERLEPAKALLREQYAAIGILEEFNTTLHLFDRVLDMPGLDWPGAFGQHGIVNKNSKFESERENELGSAWQDDRIKHYLRLDIELYDYAVRLFHEQVSSVGVH